MALFAFIVCAMKNRRRNNRRRRDAETSHGAARFRSKSTQSNSLSRGGLYVIFIPGTLFSTGNNQSRSRMTGYGREFLLRYPDEAFRHFRYHEYTRHSVTHAPFITMMCKSGIAAASNRNNRKRKLNKIQLRTSLENFSSPAK